MKIYRKPKAKIVNTKGHVILAGSGGVETGSTPGNGYNKDDVSYSKSIFDYESE